jgi:Protein of unknown function (DUF2938)
VPQVVEFIVRAVLIGAGATVILDLWALVSTRAYGTPAPRWDLVGRWIAYLPRGRFSHASIGQTPAIPGELMIGWLFHYAVGIFYAALLLAIWGLEWARQPTLAPALILSFLTLVAPFLIMQPGMGAGIAASRTPDPNAARLRSVIGHTVFGLGLYVSALVSRSLIPGM